MIVSAAAAVREPAPPPPTSSPTPAPPCPLQSPVNMSAYSDDFTKNLLWLLLPPCLVSRWRRVVPGGVRVHLRREVAGPGRGGGGGRGERGGAGAGVGGELPGRAQGGAGAAGGDLREQQPHSQTAGYRWGETKQKHLPVE